MLACYFHKNYLIIGNGIFSISWISVNRKQTIHEFIHLHIVFKHYLRQECR